MATPRITVEKLRFNDTDLLGHINNAVYTVILEAGRVELVREAGLLNPAAGHGVVIARLELDKAWRHETELFRQYEVLQGLQTERGGTSPDEIEAARQAWQDADTARRECEIKVKSLEGKP